MDKADYSLKVDVDSNFDKSIIDDEKWKNWVFELSGSYDSDREESRKTDRYDIEFEIDKLTPDWRIGIELERSESNRRYYSDDNVYTSNRKTTRIRGRVVKVFLITFQQECFLGLLKTHMKTLILAVTSRLLLNTVTFLTKMY